MTFTVSNIQELLLEFCTIKTELSQLLLVIHLDSYGQEQMMDQG